MLFLASTENTDSIHYKSVTYAGVAGGKNDPLAVPGDVDSSCVNNFVSISTINIIMHILASFGLKSIILN